MPPSPSVLHQFASLLSFQYRLVSLPFLFQTVVASLLHAQCREVCALFHQGELKYRSREHTLSPNVLSGCSQPSFRLGTLRLCVVSLVPRTTTHPAQQYFRCLYAWMSSPSLGLQTDGRRHCTSCFEPRMHRHRLFRVCVSHD